MTGTKTNTWPPPKGPSPEPPESKAKCAILYTIVENCRRLGIHTREYLEDVLTRLPALKDAREAASLTPAKWLAARTAKAARPAA